MRNASHEVTWEQLAKLIWEQSKEFREQPVKCRDIVRYQTRLVSVYIDGKGIKMQS